MKQFEYKWQKWDFNEIVDTPSSTLSKYLELMGEEGWELCAISPGDILFFKREIIKEFIEEDD